jgi:hypothetical protein
MLLFIKKNKIKLDHGHGNLESGKRNPQNT